MHAIHHLPGHLESHLTTISCTNCKKHSLIIYLLINVFLWQFTLLININAFFIVWTHGAAVRQDDWIWLMQLSPGNAYIFFVFMSTEVVCSCPRINLRGLIVSLCYPAVKLEINARELCRQCTIPDCSHPSGYYRAQDVLSKIISRFFGRIFRACSEQNWAAECQSLV